jgi:hypothetical protein
MSRHKQNKITKLESSANLENKKQKTWKFFLKERNTDFLHEMESLCPVTSIPYSQGTMASSMWGYTHTSTCLLGENLFFQLGKIHGQSINN